MFLMETAEVAPNTIGGAQYLAFLIGVLIPIGVGLVTTHTTSTKTKALINLGASALTGFLTEWLTALNSNAHFVWQQALFGVVAAFITSIGALYGFYKPALIDNRLKSIGQK